MGFWKRFKGRASKRKSVFFTLLLSYIAVFLLPVLIGTALYGKVEGIMIETASRNNKAMLEQVRLGVDSRVKEVNQLARQIALNPKLQWLLDNKDYSDKRDLYKFVEFMKDLSRHGTINSYISNFYVYFANTDTVLTPSMRTDSRMYFEGFAGYEEIDYGTYRSAVLDDVHRDAFLPSVPLKNDIRVITYAQSLPLGERTDPKGTLVILIDEKQIRDLLDQIEWVSSGSIYILNEEGEVIMTTSDRPVFASGLKARLAGFEDYLPYTDERGEEMVVTHTSSEQNGWTYVSVVPKAIVLEKANMVKTWAIALVWVCLVGGAVASYVMAYKNYRPIRDMVNAIVQSRSLAKDHYANEYDLIKKSIVSSIDEERRLKRTIFRQAPVIQADFLSRLVRGHVDVSTISDDDLRFMGVKFPTDRFGVILVDIDDGNRFMKEESEKEWALMRFILANLGEELLGERGYPLEMELSRVLFLVCLPEEDDASKSQLSEFVSGMSEVMEQRFRTQVTLAISRVHRGLGAIAECYGEAVIAMDYKMIKGPNSIIYYDELAALEPGHYHFPTATEVQLMNYVKSGDYANTETTLNQIYEVNFGSRGLTPEMGKCLIFDLLSTYLKLTQTLGTDGAFQGEPDPVKLIASCTTAEEMFRRTKSLFQQLCERADQGRSSHTDRLYLRMKEYVEEHFADSNFSVVTIADHFGLHPSYLSSFFKKHSGENVSDYILRLRLAESKRLLADKSYTLSDIAARVGYANSVGLIRVFKKAEGITPGQYRINLEKTGAS